MSVPWKLRSRERWLVAYAGCIAVVAGGLIYARPKEMWGILAMGAAGVLMAWAIVRLGTRQVRERLHKLREVTDALGSGRLMEHIRGLPKDEFVKLSDSVDRLAGQLREMAAEQDRLRQRLGRSEKLAVMGELAATVAHEVNNPLDGLQNSINILRRRMENDEQTGKLLDMMEAGLNRIETTVRRLLSMSKDEPIHLGPAAVEAIVDDAVMFVQPRLNRYGVRLMRDFPATPMMVMADAVHLAQALINLMINAADAMRETGGTLTLRCRASDDGRTVFLDVIDTGTGIAQEDLPRIFEPFYSTKGKGQGTGLGLAVVARLIEAHHGRIEVQTQAGKGTCFRLELPAATAESVGAQLEFNPDRTVESGAAS